MAEYKSDLLIWKVS